MKIPIMKSISLALLSIFFVSSALFAQSIHYHLKMEKPENHYFQVEVELKDWKKKTLDLHLPVWAPGSYLVREFAKNINLVKAKDEKGNHLKVTKTSKNVWTVQNEKARNFKVFYEVYAFELSVRTSYLDFTHGFVSGSGVFMFTPDLLNKSGKLTIHPHSYFKKVTTALQPAGETLSSDNAVSYDFVNYDELVDSPIEIGNQVEFNFEAAGTNHTVAIYGEGNYNIDRLKEDMAVITTNATAVFGQNPNKKYVFIIHNVTDGQGGLEHTASTVLSVNRWTYQGEEYLGFLSLVAHEYFHLWNVKRIRPIELGPFNYDQENYTTLLWVMEGFTSYYDELLLLRSGYYSQELFLQKLNGSLNYVEGTLGSRVQPLAHASFDAWIKAYRPNENSSNTTMTYYTRGQLMAAIFDAMIVYESKGQYCLDDFLQALYTKFYVKENRGFTELEFRKELEKWTKQDLSEFWANFIHGTEMPDYDVYFRRVGVEVKLNMAERPSFGASITDQGNVVLVRSVRTGSAAENAGLAAGDEILAVEGFRVNSRDLNDLFETVRVGDQFKILFSRDKVLFESTVTIDAYKQPRFELSTITTSQEKMLRDFWLR